MSKPGIFMQQHLAAVQQQPLKNVTTDLGGSWTSTQVHPLPLDVTTKQGQNHQRGHSTSLSSTVVCGQCGLHTALFISLYPLQGQKCKIFPKMQWKKPAEKDKGARKRPRWVEYVAAQLTLQQQTASRDERGSVIRAGFPSLPAEAPEAARKTLWWVGMGENQEASRCEVCWVTLAGFALPWGLSTFLISDFWKICFLLIYSKTC